MRDMQRWGCSGMAAWSASRTQRACGKPASLSQDPLPRRHLVVHRRAFQSPHGPAPRHPEHARALESCTGSGGVHRRAGVDRRRRRGLPGLAGRQEGRPGAARAVAGHARQARQLRCSPLPQGRTPRGQHVGSCCLCPTSLCSGDGAAPAGAKRSGLPVACVKLIVQTGALFGPINKVGIPTSHPEACRGPYLYQKGRPEVAFDPSRRICSGFRPEAGLPGLSLVSEGAPGSRL